MRLSARRIGGWLWGGAGALLVAYVFVLLLLIIYRHPKRFDFSQEQVNTLSPETLNRLSLLKEKVVVVLPVLFQSKNPLHEIQGQILWRARALLEEYAVRQPLLSVESELNLARPADIDRWKELRERYDLPDQVNRFIFLARDGELRQSITPDDLAVYDRPEGKFDAIPPQVKKFRGEAAFTGALTRIVNRERKRVYAVEDHREAQTADDTPRGLSQLRRELEASGYEVNALRLHSEPRVPANCDVLLIAGPESGFELEDRVKVNDYLLQGGRLLVALSQADTGLETLLDGYDVRVLPGRVLERQVRGPRADWSPTFLARDFNRYHPIGEPFQNSGFGIIESGARALDLKESTVFRADWLLRTQAVPVSFLDRNRNGREDEGEPEARLVLAAAVSRRPPSRPVAIDERVDTRIVVLGDATPLLNAAFDRYSHRSFLLNAMSWLAGREEQLAAGSTEWTQRKLKWDPGIDRFIFWVPIFVFPAIVVSLGAFVYFLRRV